MMNDSHAMERRKPKEHSHRKAVEYREYRMHESVNHLPFSLGLHTTLGQFSRPWSSIGRRQEGQIPVAGAAVAISMTIVAVDTTPCLRGKFASAQEERDNRRWGSHDCLL